MVNHFLIGIPSSGKSTLAAYLNQLEPNSIIISTDAIRAQLFGDETIQGDWSLIEVEVLTQMQQAWTRGQAIIYDATNAKREWRKSMLSKVSSETQPWLAWHLKTSLEICLTWNQKRQRQVSSDVMVEFYRSLNQEPPHQNEGFLAVNAVFMTPDGLDFIQIKRQFMNSELIWTQPGLS